MNYKKSIKDLKARMQSNSLFNQRAVSLVLLIITLTVASTRLHADNGTCGGAITTLPFTDVPASNIFFCSIASAYFSALTNGTTATTYSPSASVTREQMAAFITRTQDSALRRGSRRGALDQWATPTFSAGGQTTVGTGPWLVKSDGADLWVANSDDTVSRVRASDGKLLETWTNALDANAVLVARGRIFVTGNSSPGKLYRFDPRQPAGDVTLVTSNLGGNPASLAYDGEFIWTANGSGSVSKVDPGNGSVTTFTGDFIFPLGILYDGANIWVTDAGAGTLRKLNSNGTVAQSVPLGAGGSRYAIFDGANIWVANQVANSVTVVRASTGVILATLTGNGLDGPIAPAFDGERILVTNVSGDSVSLWKATDLTPLGSFDAGTNTSPYGACSDGINFWVTLANTNKLARF